MWYIISKKLLLKLNSATGREFKIDKPNVIMRSIPVYLQLLDNKRRDCIF